MRNLTLAAAAAVIALTSGIAAAKDWTTVRIGTEGEYPPFNYFDTNNELQGFDIDIAKALCEKMEVECVFVAQDWDGIIPALLAGKYDAIIASMSITEERLRTVDFSDKYYSTPPALIAPKDSDTTETTPEAWAGKTIGAQSATTHATYLEDVYKDSTIRLYGAQEEANLDLQSGRIDAIMADSVVLDEWLKDAGADCCKLIGMVENDPKYFGEGAGIAVRKDDTELKEMFNEALAAILADGTYQAINDKYFEFSVY